MISLAFPGPPEVRGAVVVSEFLYHPPASASRNLEFVEVHNTGSAPVALEGWRLLAGADFTFPPAAVLPPGGFLAVCRDPALLRTVYGGLESAYLGGFEGSMDNAGEKVLLLDSFNAIADAVPYDDRLPWPEDADGKGFSLSRLCLSSPARDPLNWSAGSPTPGAPNESSACPPPAYQIPRIVISEIHYHPRPADTIRSALEDGEDEEFLEIHNPGAEPVDMGGWRLADGVLFVFQPGTIIPAGGCLAVCRNAAAVRERFGIQEAVGDYTGKLSNEGERVALHDDGDRWVDSVRYADSGDWPYGADGFGQSIEKVSLSSPGDDPANWSLSCSPSDRFGRITSVGKWGQGGMSQKFLISLNGPGEVLVDEVSMEDVTKPGQNIIANGSFDAGIEGWTVSGIASGSVFAPGEGESGTGALRLISTGTCDGECGTLNGVHTPLPPDLDRDADYRVSVVFRRVQGSSIFRAGKYGGVTAASSLATPGRPNSVSAPAVPPSISLVRRFPLEPRSTDPVWITALLRGQGTPTLNLVDESGQGSSAFVMLDDGLHKDGEAGDGVFGVELPPRPHDAQVRFRVHATFNEGAADHPRFRFCEIPLPHEVDGYYVNDLQPSSVLPIYHILLPGVPTADPVAINMALNCFDIKTASFALAGDLYPDVGLRFRGNTACAVKKRNFKVIFERGRLLGRLRKLNLNALWTDKALVRERLSWEFLREIGTPYCETRYVRLHLNGAYHGLFLEVEHPDERFLKRNGLDEGGNLYKSLQPSFTEEVVGVEKRPTLKGYRDGWSEESNEGGDYTDIAGFIDSMHLDAVSAGGPTVGFWSGNSFEEMIIGYQLGQVVLNNIDSYAKNHFLYHDLEADRWGFLTWDLDLTFGKFFFPDAVGPGREAGTLNDFMLSDPEVASDLSPWFAARVNGEPVYNYLVDFFFRAGGGHYQRSYLVQLWDILEEKYRNEVFDPRLDGLRALLREEEAQDFARWGRYPSNVPDYPQDMDANIEIVKDQIALHREFLRDYISEKHPQIPSRPRVKITEIQYWPEGGADDLEFIEFVNTESRPVDISGWSLSGVSFVFPQESVIPAGEVFVLARSPEIFEALYRDRQFPFLFGPYEGRLANEGEELRLLDAGPGYPATIERVAYGNDAPWPRGEPGSSIELTSVSANRDSGDPANWVLSAEIGGSPGKVIPPRFRRGDPNGDRKADLSDAIFTLSHLFLGGDDPACMDSADVDDSGKVDLTDPVFLLQFLYLAGPPPASPGTEACGEDPTPDSLSSCLYDCGG